MNANPAAPELSTPNLSALAPAFAKRFAVIAAALVALIARAFLRHSSPRRSNRGGGAATFRP